MAIGIAGIAHSTNLNTGTPVTSITLPAFTPSNSSLCVIAFYGYNDNASNTSSSVASMTCTSAGLTWTNQLANVNPSGSGVSQVFTTIFTSPIATGASTTCTVSGFSGTGNATDYAYDVYCITGYNTSTPVGATGKGTSTASGAGSVTLSGAPSATSVVVGHQNYDPTGNGDTIVQGSGWTQLYNLLGNRICSDTQYLIGTTSTTVPWQDLTGPGDTAWRANQVAIEFIAAGGVAASLTPFRKPLRAYQRRY